MKPIKILLIEDNILDKNQFLSLEINKDWHLECVENSFIGLKKIKEDLKTYWLVLISETVGPLKAKELKQYLNDLKVINTVIEVKQGNTDSQNQSEVLQITKPFSKNSIEFLEKYLNEADLITNDTPIYGLDYLKNISHNNDTFIFEMIQVFLSVSVVRLEEMKMNVKFLDEDSIFKVKQVAHALKPSFEMVENFEGKELCHKIFYTENLDEIPTCVLKLEQIFNKIKEAIKQDFPDKF